MINTIFIVGIVFMYNIVLLMLYLNVQFCFTIQCRKNFFYNSIYLRFLDFFYKPGYIRI